VQLSPHFTLEEMVASQVAERLGIDNTPTPEVVARLQHLCERALEPARAAVGPIRISSGYRSPALNAAIPGSSKVSDHQYGDAADCLPLQASKLALARWFVANIDFDQVILEFGTEDEPAWVHVSTSPKRRRQVLRILKGTGYVPIAL